MEGRLQRTVQMGSLSQNGIIDLLKLSRRVMYQQSLTVTGGSAILKSIRFQFPLPFARSQDGDDGKM